MAPTLELHLIFPLRILLYNLNTCISGKKGGEGGRLNIFFFRLESNRKKEKNILILVEIKRSYFKKNV